MIARVPVYGTTDAGRNLYLRIKGVARNLDLKRLRFFLPCISLQVKTKAMRYDLHARRRLSLSRHTVWGASSAAATRSI